VVLFREGEKSRIGGMRGGCSLISNIRSVLGTSKREGGKRDFVAGGSGERGGRLLTIYIFCGEAFWGTGEGEGGLSSTWGRRWGDTEREEIDVPQFFSCSPIGKRASKGSGKKNKRGDMGRERCSL